MCEYCSRREFLEAGVAAGLMVNAAALTYAWAADTPPPRPRGKSRICVLFSGVPVSADRDWGADAGQVEAMKSRLAQAEKELVNIELLIGESRSAEETAALLEKAGPKTPVLAINVENFALTRVVQPVLDGAHPLLVFSLPASGHDWMYAHRWRRAGHRVTLFLTACPQ